MRHLKAGKRLGLTTSHRKAVMRNLVTALLQNGEIKTTLTRAKEMRKYFDKMIGHGKKGNLHSKRQAFGFIKSRDVVAKLFDEYGPLYKDRSGGYTRIFRLGNRLGDNAQMALIQMVGVKETEPVKPPVEKESIVELKEELQGKDQESETVSEEVKEEIAEEAKETATNAEAKTEETETSEGEKSEERTSEKSESEK